MLGVNRPKSWYPKTLSRYGVFVSRNQLPPRSALEAVPLNFTVRASQQNLHACLLKESDITFEYEDTYQPVPEELHVAAFTLPITNTSMQIFAKWPGSSSTHPSSSPCTAMLDDLKLSPPPMV
ncbi:predicted protein [Lichtheimia corymbifera JMRC:FSU:9682]|uniref:Uncharacterized protein n=1 Tax=Lichtheimia corymbifera JMRC:FSU:9682 TaxID=1263082 RepID=A0A068RJA1_9FUNG|nr:predicted protein [Lichtheimia corymbifera JMRC:FSU:9682]